MSQPKYLTSPPEQTGMPSGVPYIVGNEAAERFSFYGMKTVLAVFMTKYLLDASGQPDHMSDAESSTWIHNFNAAVYFFPIIGAVISDWLTGKYLMILWLSMVYCAGHAVLALMDLHVGVDQRTLLFWGLALIAVGAGGIKPCVSAHVGDQFGRANQHLLPVVFGWFYFSINFGSTFSTLLTPWLRDRWGPSWAFGVPGLLMALATLVFWSGRNKFVHVPPSGSRFFKETFGREGLWAIVNLIPLYLLVAPFWSLFDQTGSRWVLQAERMNRQIVDLGALGIDPKWTTPTSDQLQAVNPILVMVFIPIFSYLIYPTLGKWFAVTPLRRIGIGLCLTIPSFIIPAWVEGWIAAGQTPHIGWQILAYAILTAAEVLISITCLEFSYTQAPNVMKSFIMGLYLLSIALGNKFTAFVNDRIAASETAGGGLLQGPAYYWFFVGVMGATAAIYVVWSPFYAGRTFIQSDVEKPAAAGENGARGET
jgi:POT family proton-dependent oligopeptide transporter